MRDDPQDLDGIREWLDRYMDPDPLDKALAADPLDFSSLQRREIGLLLVRVRSEELEMGHSRVRQVVDFVAGRGAVVSDIVSTFLIAGYGIHGGDPAVADRARELADALVQHFGSEVSVLLHIGEGLVGTYGGEGRMTFGPFDPHLIEQVGRLLEVSWGEVREGR